MLFRSVEYGVVQRGALPTPELRRNDRLYERQRQRVNDHRLTTQRPNDPTIKRPTQTIDCVVAPALLLDGATHKFNKVF